MLIGIMASLRGFNLAKLSQIRVVFSSFDNRISSARYVRRAICCMSANVELQLNN